MQNINDMRFSNTVYHNMWNDIKIPLTVRHLSSLLVAEMDASRMHISVKQCTNYGNSIVSCLLSLTINIVVTNNVQ